MKCLPESTSRRTVCRFVGSSVHGKQKGHTGLSPVCPSSTEEATNRRTPPLRGGRAVHRQLVLPLRRRAVVARILDLGEAQELESADVDPADVELEPARLELRTLRVGVVVVVQLLAAEPDGNGGDVPALVLHLEVAV